MLSNSKLCFGRVDFHLLIERPFRRASNYFNITLRVHVPNNHILTQNLYYNYYYPKPKYPIIGYMDPLGNLSWLSLGGWRVGV